jgi:hypothetical protein
MRLNVGRSNRKATRIVLVTAGFAICCTAGGTARAVPVGAGTGITNEANDSAGGRINVDQGSPVTLQPGTYVATAFRFDAGLAGDVTPFLARSSGTDTYVTLAVGSPQTIAAAAQDQTLPFGGAATFTLTTPTQVFAGIASQTQNPIALDNGTANNTDHEGGGQAPTSYVINPTPGGTVPPDGAFSNPNLGRTYAFSIEADLIPEPTGLALAAVGGVGLLSRRRRRV